MLSSVVVKMTALTECSEIAGPVISGIVVEMRRRQDDLGLPELSLVIGEINPVDYPALAVTPDLLVRIEPAPIAEMADHPPMRPAAALTAPPCPLETNHSAELNPVDRVKTPELLLDRH